MDSELEMWMILITLIVSGLSIAIAAWVPRRKRFADWFMVAGATMMPLGLIAMTFHVEVLSYQYHKEWIERFLIGAMCGGAVLFAMGYVRDRLSRRQEQSYQVTTQGLPLPPR